MFIVYILIGFFSGIIGGMGVGGGAILIPLIRFFADVNQTTAQSINLLYFIPTAIAAVIIHLKHKSFSLKPLIPLIISSIVGGLLGSMIAVRMPSAILGKLFGGFLIILAFRELYIVKTHKKP